MSCKSSGVISSSAVENNESAQGDILGSESCDDMAIRVSRLSKCYHIYDWPHDRLKQFMLPRLQTLMRQNPHQYFREFWALKDVSFEVSRGQTVGIVGRNGSGKSTLLQLIVGTLAATTGTVEVNGRLSALLELGAGFNPEFSGRENIYLNGTIIGLSTNEIDERIDSILEFADIGDFIEQPVKTYSSGMYVRLAFAIQANVDPQILIVDEALAVGDAYFVHRCMLRISELQKSGTTIVLVSHDANAVRNLCSRAIWLLDGTIQEEGDSSKVIDAYLAHLFGHQVATKGAITDVKTKDTEQKLYPSLQMETTIPNIDRRLGDQRCEIIGVGLYDHSMNKISSTFHEKAVLLRLTVQNYSLDPTTELAVGYIFRNGKGQEIASTNSQIEGKIIGPMVEGGFLTVRMTVNLPCLHPGSYAFSVAAGYIGDREEIILSDRIENAIVFNVLSTKRVHVLMNFSTTIEVEV